MEILKKSLLLNGAAILSAGAASLCCILPVAIAVLGVGSAALGARLQPYRPWLILLTVGFLGVAHYLAYRPQPCEPRQACAARRHRIFLSTVSIAALLLMALPYYVEWIL